MSHSLVLASSVSGVQKQDETLENFDMAVTRVGYMAETIHEEIDQQNKMLTDLDDDLADAEEQLGVVMGKLAKLLKTKNKCQIGLIIILSLIVLLLFFLVVYTWFGMSTGFNSGWLEQIVKAMKLSQQKFLDKYVECIQSDRFKF